MQFFSDDARAFLHYQGYGPWVERLEKVIPRALEEHGLVIEEVVYKGLVSVVLFVHNRRGERIVAKFSPAKVIADQITTLRLLAGRTVPHLIDYDPRYDLLLLEYIEHELDQEINDRELAEALSHWDRPAPPAMPSVYQENLNEINLLLENKELSREQLAALILARKQLMLLPQRDRLIHRDLHPDNILRGSDGQVVILDPHGGRGSVSYDIAYITTFDESDFNRFAERVEEMANHLSVEVREIHRWSLIRTAIRSSWLDLYWKDQQASQQTFDLFKQIKEKLLDQRNHY